jgi:hypothetical protein
MLSFIIYMSGLLIFFICEIVILVLLLVYTFYTGISPVPTSRKVKNLLLENLPDISTGSIFELGSGWGTLAFPVAGKFPLVPVNAYEISPVPWFYSRIRKLIISRKNLTLYRKNFHNISLKDASLIICYLHPGGMKRLKRKFEKELKPGAVIMCNTFQIDGWEPAAVHEIDKLYDNIIYIYQVI